MFPLFSSFFPFFCIHLTNDEHSYLPIRPDPFALSRPHYDTSSRSSSFHSNVILISTYLYDFSPSTLSSVLSQEMRERFKWDSVRSVDEDCVSNQAITLLYFCILHFLSLHQIEYCCWLLRCLTFKFPEHCKVDREQTSEVLQMSTRSTPLVNDSQLEIMENCKRANSPLSFTMKHREPFLLNTREISCFQLFSSLLRTISSFTYLPSPTFLRYIRPSQFHHHGYFHKYSVC